MLRLLLLLSPYLSPYIYCMFHLVTAERRRSSFIYGSNFAHIIIIFRLQTKLF